MSVSSTFPRIPHLLGSKASEDDRVLDADMTSQWLGKKVRAFEKLDGINVSFMCVGRGHHVRFAIKPEWMGALGGRVERAINLWTQLHYDQLRQELRDGAHLYAEWVWHRISVRYSSLSSPLLGIAFREESGRLLAFDHAKKRIEKAGLNPTSPLFEGVLKRKSTLQALAKKSLCGASVTEGVVLEDATRRFLDEEAGWAKWVRADYVRPKAHALSGTRNDILNRVVPA